MRKKKAICLKTRVAAVEAALRGWFPVGVSSGGIEQVLKLKMSHICFDYLHVKKTPKQQNPLGMALSFSKNNVCDAPESPG